MNRLASLQLFFETHPSIVTFLGLTTRCCLVILLAILLTRLLRKTSATGRHLVWFLAISGLGLLPTLSLILPKSSIAILPALEQAAPVMLERAIPAAAAVRPGDGVPRTLKREAPLSATAAYQAPSWQTLLWVFYLVPLIGALCYLGLGMIQVWRLTKTGSPVRDPQWRHLTDEYKTRLKIRRPVYLRQTAKLASPITWGLFRPVVILPVESMTWSYEQKRNVLLHELSHVCRMDWFSTLVARCTCLLHWFNPLAWVALRKLMVEAERACDDRVLVDGCAPLTYADQLFGVAQRAHETRNTAFSAAAMAQGSDLKERLTAILNPQLRRDTMSFSRMTFATAMGMALALVLASVELTARPANGTEAREVVDLIEAAGQGDLQRVQLMIDDQIEIDGHVGRSGTALIAASSVGDDEMVKLLLNNGAKVNKQTRGRYGSALNAAAAGGFTHTLALLLENGAKVKAVPRGNGSALMKAARGGHLEAGQYLVEAGANVNRSVKGDGSPLIVAARGGHAEMVRFLLDQDADASKAVRGDGNPLIMAARGGYLDVARMLIESGADVNKAVPGDETPLMNAQRNGHRKMMSLLIENGVDVNQKHTGDGTALIQATASGDVDMVSDLIEAGADVDVSVLGDGTALIQAAARGQLETVQLLINNGADVNKGVRGDANPLIAATARGHLEVVKLLVASDANVNSYVRGDETPLMRVARGGHHEIARYLIENGADVNKIIPAIERGKPRTALGEATREGDQKMIELLRGHGARE